MSKTITTSAAIQPHISAENHHISASEKIIPMKRYKLMPSARNQKNQIKSINQRAKAGEFCS